MTSLITSVNDHFLGVRFGMPAAPAAAIDARVVADVARGIARANAELGLSLATKEIKIDPESRYQLGVYEAMAYALAVQAGTTLG
jgi:hypothetical protein